MNEIPDPILATFAAVAALATLWNVNRVGRLNSIRDTHDGFVRVGRHAEVLGWSRDCVACSAYCPRLVWSVDHIGFSHRLPCGRARPCALHPEFEAARDQLRAVLWADLEPRLLGALDLVARAIAKLHDCTIAQFPRRRP